MFIAIIIYHGSVIDGMKIALLTHNKGFKAILVNNATTCRFKPKLLRSIHENFSFSTYIFKGLDHAGTPKTFSIVL